MQERPHCRGCSAELSETFADLGVSPLSNAFLGLEAIGRPELFYPLHAYVCSRCLLVQLEAFESPATIFSEYPYFSSFAETWIAHARDFAALATERLGLSASSKVVELASNDGYLLAFFKERGFSVLGIEPAANVARIAEERGIPTRVTFFGVAAAEELRREGWTADLMVANNVLAHVPDLHDFVAGIAIVLAPGGRVSIEFPHLLELIERVEFDTIYHEHFSYFSLIALEPVFQKHGLRIVSVERLSTHGGSLRLWLAHEAAAPPDNSVAALVERERAAGLDRLDSYTRFGTAIEACKRDALRFLIAAKEAGKTVAGYGAPAKGNTFLNYCGIRHDLLSFTVDRNEYKQGRYLPGTHIPVYTPEAIVARKPDYVLILPWNLKDEIVDQMREIFAWGGRFVTAIPTITIIDQ